jgi:hypothetical protein
MISGQMPGTSQTVAKHTAIVQNRTSKTAIAVFPALNARQRSSLLSHNVPFIVPFNQLFVPALAIDLREHFVNLGQRLETYLSPTAQAIVLQRLIAKDSWSGTTSSIRRCLGLTTVSVIRAFDELESLDVTEGGKAGREREIVFRSQGRNLFDRCVPLFRSPVRSTKAFVSDNIRYPALPAAGESALSALTDLAPPTSPVFAVSSKSWKTLTDLGEPVTSGDRSFVIEGWSYDPIPLGGLQYVDPLSLYIQFRLHPDERIALAAGMLLEDFKW